MTFESEGLLIVAIYNCMSSPRVVSGLRIYAALALFQSYRDLEAGDCQYPTRTSDPLPLKPRALPLHHRLRLNNSPLLKHIQKLCATEF